MALQKCEEFGARSVISHACGQSVLMREHRVKQAPADAVPLPRFGNKKVQHAQRFDSLHDATLIVDKESHIAHLDETDCFAAFSADKETLRRVAQKFCGRCDDLEDRPVRDGIGSEKWGKNKKFARKRVIGGTREQNET